MGLIMYSNWSNRKKNFFPSETQIFKKKEKACSWYLTIRQWNQLNLVGNGFTRLFSIICSSYLIFSLPSQPTELQKFCCSLFLLFVSYGWRPQFIVLYHALKPLVTVNPQKNISWFINDIPLMPRQFNVKKLQSLFVPASF